MRPIWTGGITFGLIYIPVKMYSATQPIELDLDYLSKKEHAPIRYARINTETGKEVAWEDIVRGYEHKKGDYVVLEPEDFENADFEKSSNVEIDCFVDEKEIESIYFEKPYYLEPEKGAEKTYVLLRDALKKSGRVGLAEFVLRNREHLCILQPHGKVLVLNQLRYEDEIKPVNDLHIPGKVQVDSSDVKLATDLIDKMTEEFDPAEYEDNYIEKLKKLIAAKAKHKKYKAEKREKKEATDMDELMEKLKKSLAEIK